MTFEDLPLRRSPYIVDSNRTVVSPNSKTLRLMVESNHWEHFDHSREYYGDYFVTVFAKS